MCFSDCAEHCNDKDSFSVDNLPDELRDYIKRDNERFQLEIDAWDAEQRQMQMNTKSDSNKPSYEMSNSASQNERLSGGKSL